MSMKEWTIYVVLFGDLGYNAKLYIYVDVKRG
jgi:hypothetical protein